MMTAYQLHKTARNWQGLSDRVAYRGSFSSPPGAYPPPENGTACLTRSNSAASFSTAA